VSKNVAVFVDVANIFYAAKAAGVDIDYVTLLKNATAGRDFVRAYAYTGLDPDNDNQRQFHQFLARHDYKVVSKDIRKYGDGKVKANLDIELVVDLMKTARNLDIAVVVSGDGDFAPAIRAVQEMGVRVEVISFRGNTSSDLMDVADVFTDITQIARVEKESSRSGRRVAAEDDLSMTAVPDKESEGAPRRRRTTRARPERAETVAAEPRPRGRREPAGDAVPAVPAAPPAAGVVVALPGERLSRAAARPAAEADAHEPEIGSGAEPAVDGGRAGEVDAEGAPRRRRRRGGRGRGRGRGERPVPGEQPAIEEGEAVEEEVVDFSAPRAPQPTPFGSIWDSQLGVPSSPILAGEQLDDVPDDEPEIPEYLLAERRQQRGGPPRAVRGGRGRGGAYQVALDRERFGRGNAPSGGGGGGFSGAPRVSRAPVSRGPRPDRAPRQDRPPRQYVETPRRESDGSPWSEVPPELEAQLRAELARRPAREPAAVVTRSETVPATEPIATAAPAGAPRRARPRKTADAVVATPVEAVSAAAAEVVTRPRRTRTTAKAAVDATPPVEPEATAKPKRTRAPRKPASEA